MGASPVNRVRRLIAVLDTTSERPNSTPDRQNPTPRLAMETPFISHRQGLLFSSLCSRFRRNADGGTLVASKPFPSRAKAAVARRGWPATHARRAAAVAAIALAAVQVVPH
eukprot:365157-Chlamydomonas_euryale.AAC.35